MVVVLQNDLLSAYSTRLAAPHDPATSIRSADRLHPVLRVEDSDYLLATEQMGAIELNEAGAVVGSARAMRYEITRACDIVLSGV